MPALACLNCFPEERSRGKQSRVSTTPFPLGNSSSITKPAAETTDRKTAGKVNSEWVVGLKVRFQTQSMLGKKKKKKTLQHLSTGKDFLERILTAQKIIVKIEIWDCIQSKACTHKGKYQQSEETAPRMAEDFTKNMYVRELTSRPCQ